MQLTQLTSELHTDSILLNDSIFRVGDPMEDGDNLCQHT